MFLCFLLVLLSDSHSLSLPYTVPLLSLLPTLSSSHSLLLSLLPTLSSSPSLLLIPTLSSSPHPLCSPKCSLGSLCVACSSSLLLTRSYNLSLSSLTDQTKAGPPASLAEEDESKIDLFGEVCFCVSITFPYLVMTS